METPIISHTPQVKKDADRELVKNVGHDETKLVTTGNERE
jgi:hypothetical protein